jgi:hypothetical protein
MTGEIPWWNEPAILFNKNHWMNFFPNPDSPITTAYNAIVRFSIYGGIILFAVTRNSNYLLAIPIVMLTTYLLYQISPPKEHMATMREQYMSFMGVKPTVDNPMMNVQVHEYGTNPTRDKAANITNSEIKKEATAAFYKGTKIMDLAETRDKKFLERQFVTSANTTIPNDNGSFAKFLFKDSVKTPKISYEGQFAPPGSLN